MTKFRVVRAAASLFGETFPSALLKPFRAAGTPIVRHFAIRVLRSIPGSPAGRKFYKTLRDRLAERIGFPSPREPSPARRGGLRLYGSFRTFCEDTAAALWTTAGVRTGFGEDDDEEVQEVVTLWRCTEMVVAREAGCGDRGKTRVLTALGFRSRIA